MADSDPILPEESTGFELAADLRPHMPIPLPVRLVAVADVRLPALVDLERPHDDFYCGLLKMERDEPRTQRIYRTDTFRIIFEVGEGPIERNEIRPICVELDSLRELEAKLIDREIAYEWVRTLNPGEERLVLRDPSGNWVEVMERREIM